MKESQGFFTPTDSRLENRDVEMSVESPSLVGTIVGNSSDAVINGRPMKKRPLLAGVAGRSKMPRCNSVINQGADILFPPIVQKEFSFYFPHRNRRCIERLVIFEVDGSTQKEFLIARH